MTQFDQNGNMFFGDGWMLRKDGAFIPASIIDSVGIPAGDWLRRVRAYLIQNKERLAISTVKFRTEAQRVHFDITFDTGRFETHDSWVLLERTWAALQEQGGYAFYDYGQAMQIVENTITIAKG